MKTRTRLSEVPEVHPWVYPYAQIAEHYEALIRAQKLKPGQQLPAIKAIAREWNVSHATAQRAINRLRRDKLVKVRHGNGTFVADEIPP